MTNASGVDILYCQSCTVTRVCISVRWCVHKLRTMLSLVMQRYIEMEYNALFVSGLH